MHAELENLGLDGTPKCLHVADVALRVSQVVGNALLSSGNTAAALAWLWRAHDSSALKRVAEVLQASAASSDELAKGVLR